MTYGAIREKFGLSRPLIKCRRQFAIKWIRTVAIRPARPPQAAEPDDLPNLKGQLTDRSTRITFGPFECADRKGTNLATR
jgi:hypothetical protein